jgi:hypothetical protein
MGLEDETKAEESSRMVIDGLCIRLAENDRARAPAWGNIS